MTNSVSLSDADATATASHRQSMFVSDANFFYNSGLDDLKHRYFLRGRWGGSTSIPLLAHPVPTSRNKPVLSIHEGRSRSAALAGIYRWIMMVHQARLSAALR